MAGGRLVEYFMVCGLGPEIQTTRNEKGFHGTDGVMYMPSLLDQFPHSCTDYPPPPPQLPMCVLPAGVEFYSTGENSGGHPSHPRSYPIVLTDGEGSKIYVGCVAFRDPVDEDIAEAYKIPANSYVDKCICVISHTPCFGFFREVLEEMHRLCFTSSGSCSKPLWDVVAHMVMNVPLPTPGQSRVLFALENTLLPVEVPPKDGFPHADLSFQPLVQCLDINNVIQLFTAVLLEKRILLRASKYSLLTIVAEGICHLIYPIKWQHVYIPVLFYGGVDYIDAPTPYLMGLHSDVDTSDLSMDGVVTFLLDCNAIIASEGEIPPLPEPELSQLRNDLMELLYPNMTHLDGVFESAGSLDEQNIRGNKPWSERHDTQLRLIFLKFFASVLSDYRNFVDYTAAHVFNKEAFVKKRSRITNLPADTMMDQFVSSQGFFDFLERGYGSAHSGLNLVDKLHAAKGQNPLTVLPLPAAEPEILTVSESSSLDSASRSLYTYDRFPAMARTQAQEEKRKSILLAASIAIERPQRHNSSPSQLQTVSKMESLSPMERAAERDRMVLDIKVKLQRLWQRLLALEPNEDPLSSSEYGTILALIESDAEGIGGSGFIECIGEHINDGWDCELSCDKFMAVKELIRTAVSRAISRNDMFTVQSALEFSALVHYKDSNNVPDYIQRHVGALPVWDELRFWEGYFDKLIENNSDKSGNYSNLVSEQLIVIAQHMAGVGLPDSEAWFILEVTALKHNLGPKQLIKLRGFLSFMQHIRRGYWGSLPGQGKSSAHHMSQNQAQNNADEEQESIEASGAGRSWVQSMFSKDRAAGRTRRAPSDSAIPVPTETAQSILPPKNVDASSLGQKRGPSGVRTLRGHKASVTVLHCLPRPEAGDPAIDYDDSGCFISGSADCTIKIWDPSNRGSELRTTLTGHTRAVRAITSDKIRVISGADDQRVLVWDKNTGQLSEELKGHDGQISCVQMISDPCVITASHDGSVKMWDVRTDTCVATICRTSCPILCMQYDHSSKLFAAAGMDGVCNVWDTRAGKQRHKLLGHTKWIRCLRMKDDIIVTGSDDWTARVWSISQGTCEAVLACHAGAITAVEYCPSDKGIVTGSADGMVRIWENNEGVLRCANNVDLHTSTILSVKAGEKWLAIGAADNSMSLFQRSERRTSMLPSSGSSARATGWKLYRTPQRTAAVVRCVASDPDKGRICSGARNGLLRLWEPSITA